MGRRCCVSGAICRGRCERFSGGEEKRRRSGSVVSPFGLHSGFRQSGSRLRRGFDAKAEALAYLEATAKATATATATAKATAGPPASRKDDKFRVVGNNRDWGMGMHWKLREWMLVGVLLTVSGGLLRSGMAQIATTSVTDTVYRANGTAATGTVLEPVMNFRGVIIRKYFRISIHSETFNHSEAA